MSRASDGGTVTVVFARPESAVKAATLFPHAPGPDAAASHPSLYGAPRFGPMGPAPEPRQASRVPAYGQFMRPHRGPAARVPVSSEHSASGVPSGAGVRAEGPGLSRTAFEQRGLVSSPLMLPGADFSASLAFASLSDALPVASSASRPRDTRTFDTKLTDALRGPNHAATWQEGGTAGGAEERWGSEIQLAGPSPEGPASIHQPWLLAPLGSGHPGDRHAT